MHISHQGVSEAFYQHAQLASQSLRPDDPGVLTVPRERVPGRGTHRAPKASKSNDKDLIWKCWVSLQVNLDQKWALFPRSLRFI